MIEIARKPESVTPGGDAAGLFQNLLGAAQMVWALVTPFLGRRRDRWDAVEEAWRVERSRTDEGRGQA